MSKLTVKRTVDQQIITDWVTPGSRVLDLGCGRGVLLETLAQSKQVAPVGVDLDVAKIASCIRRGVPAYQGDMMDFMRQFPAAHFDHVICSRTLEELHEPAAILHEALRVGRIVTVGFVNHGFWVNLVQALKKRAGAHGRSQEAELRAILADALLSPPRRNLAELLAAMPDVGVDADFRRQDDQRVAADVFD